jgi:hypothetical protein
MGGGEKKNFFNVLQQDGLSGWGGWKAIVCQLVLADNSIKSRLIGEKFEAKLRAAFVFLSAGGEAYFCDGDILMMTGMFEGGFN